MAARVVIRRPVVVAPRQNQSEPSAVGHRSTRVQSRAFVEKIWGPPRFLIPVEGLLEIFGYFLLVLIGVELLDALRAYIKKDVIHVRVVLEVALIAMARKATILEPNSVASSTSLGIAALILSLGVAFYFERQPPG